MLFLLAFKRISLALSTFDSQGGIISNELNSLKQHERRTTFFKEHSRSEMYSSNASPPNEHPTADTFDDLQSCVSVCYMILKLFFNVNYWLMSPPCPGRSTNMHRYPFTVSYSACGLNIFLEYPYAWRNITSFSFYSPTTYHHSPTTISVPFMKQRLHTSISYISAMDPACAAKSGKPKQW